MIHFVQTVPVPGTSKREDLFDEADGWVIRVEGKEVVIRRPATQNVAAVEPFRVKGVGFSEPETSPEVEGTRELALSPSESTSPPAEAPASGGAIQSRKARAKRLTP